MLNTCDSDSDNEQDWNDWNEEDASPVKCLFCDNILKTTELTLSHIQQEHEIDFQGLAKQLDFFGVIKLINFIRRNSVAAADVTNLMESNCYAADENLKPVLEDDPMLMHSFENEDDEISDVERRAQAAEQHVQVLQQTIQELQRSCQKLMENSCSEKTSPIPASDPYFDSYAGYSIHSEMLKDRSRTESYRDYIYKNPALFKDKNVLDIGCGTGILSMFCAKSGAGNVTAVDNSSIAEKAKIIVKLNKMNNVINVVRGKVEEVDLLEKSYDIIISEWMGYALLFESMLDSVLDARDKYLKPGGLMVPNRCSMSIAAVSDIKSFESRIKYWDNVYEFDMTCMVEDIVKEAVVGTVLEKNVISTECGFKHIDIQLAKVSDLEFTNRFTIEISKTSKLTALVCYFACFFDGEHSIVLDTSPFSEDTHWMQTSLNLTTPVDVLDKDVIAGTIAFDKLQSNKRAYNVTVVATVSRNGGVEVAKIDQKFILN